MNYINTNKKPDELSKLIKNDSNFIEENNDKSLIYFLATSLCTNDNKPIIKIGYSAKLNQRIENLKREYGCEFYIISVRIDVTLRDEKNLHRNIQSQYKDSIFSCKINDVSRTELYVFSEQLLEYFHECDLDIPIKSPQQLTLKKSSKPKKNIGENKTYVCEHCSCQYNAIKNLNKHKKTCYYRHKQFIEPSETKIAQLNTENIELRKYVTELKELLDKYQGYNQLYIT